MMMEAVRYMVIETIAAELKGGDIPAVLPFSIGDITRKVWDANRGSLSVGGFTIEDVYLMTISLWHYANATSWHSLLGPFLEVASANEKERQKEGLNPPETMSVTLQHEPLSIFKSGGAGALNLPSGRWAWIAAEKGDCVHVGFQHLRRSKDRMEAVVLFSDYSDAAVPRIARQPSVRWWYDQLMNLVWQITVDTQIAAGSAASITEVSFSNVTAGTRYVPAPDYVLLGELVDVQISSLLQRARERPGPPRGEGGFTSSG